jgi:hypothetical protein
MTFIQKWEAYQQKLEDRRILARVAALLDKLVAERNAPPRALAPARRAA